MTIAPKTLNEALYEAVGSNDVAGLRVLLGYGASPDAPCVTGHTVLFHAVRKDIAVMEALLDKGADVNFQGKGGYTPLAWAVFAGRKDAVELFLRRGADAELRDEYGRTAIMIAAKEGRAEMVKTLIAHGARLDTVTSRGSTLRDLAAEHPSVLAVLDDLRRRMQEERARQAAALAAARRTLVDGKQQTLKKKARDMKPRGPQP